MDLNTQSSKENVPHFWDISHLAVKMEQLDLPLEEPEQYFLSLQGSLSSSIVGLSNQANNYA